MKRSLRAAQTLAAVRAICRGMGIEVDRLVGRMSRATLVGSEIELALMEEMMAKHEDYRRATYSALLYTWRTYFNSSPGRKPLPEAFGLTPEEAAEIEANPIPWEDIPEGLRPLK